MLLLLLALLLLILGLLVIDALTVRPSTIADTFEVQSNLRIGEGGKRRKGDMSSELD